MSTKKNWEFDKSNVETMLVNVIDKDKNVRFYWLSASEGDFSTIYSIVEQLDAVTIDG